jgi:hypothetical protein
MIDLREIVEETVLGIPELLSYRIWHDNPLDGYSMVLRGEQDVAKLVSSAVAKVLSND